MACKLIAHATVVWWTLEEGGEGRITLSLSYLVTPSRPCFLGGRGVQPVRTPPGRTLE